MTTNSYRQRDGYGDPLIEPGELPGMTGDPIDGPGLYKTQTPDGRTTIRDHWGRRQKIAGGDRKERAMVRGMKQIVQAAWLLAILDLGLLVVSFAAQYSWLVVERHQKAASIIEALCVVDLPMIVLSLLGFGLALAGKKTGYISTLIVAFAGGSALMNFAAADLSSWRSILAYTAPSVALAVLAHVTFNTVRRHILAQQGQEEEATGWARFGVFLAGAARRCGIVGLYAVRFSPPDWRARIKAAAPTLEEIGLRDVSARLLTDAHEAITTMDGRIAEMRRRHQAELDEQAMRHAATLETELRSQALELDAKHGRDLAAERAAGAERLASLVTAGQNGNGNGRNGHGGSGDPEVDRLVAAMPQQPGERNKDWIARIYARHPDRWEPAKASRIATAIGRATGTSEPTARRHVKDLVDQNRALQPAPGA